MLCCLLLPGGWWGGHVFVVCACVVRCASCVAQLKVTEEMEGQEAGQGSAHAALAAAHQALGQTDKATSELEKFLTIAESTNNLTAQGEACSNLGVIYNRQGEFAKVRASRLLWRAGSCGRWCFGGLCVCVFFFVVASCT